MGKHPHRRGGSYELYKSHKITNWAYHPMDKKCLDKIRVGDIVRICFLTKNGFMKRYVQITRQVSRTHFMGCVNDPYIDDIFDDDLSCNWCGNHIVVHEIHCCGGDVDNDCNFHVHKACLKQCPTCHKVPTKLPTYDLNGSKIVFAKRNIVEIPNWTHNTELLFKKYGHFEHKNPFTACMESLPRGSIN